VEKKRNPPKGYSIQSSHSSLSPDADSLLPRIEPNISRD
jgi:hypothetical protein